MYPVTGPPAVTAAVQETVSFVLTATTVTPVGALGTGNLGVTALDAAEEALLPIAFVATTLNVYVEPFKSDATAHDVAVVVHEAPDGDEVTV